jgi:hypothetical protein
LFNELSAEKIVAEVTLGPFCGPACGSNPETNIRAQHAAPLRINIGKCLQQTPGRGMQRPHVLISAGACHQAAETKKAQPNGYAFLNCLSRRYLRFSSI